jgi:hypothetical protein
VAVPQQAVLVDGNLRVAGVIVVDELGRFVLVDLEFLPKPWPVMP